MTAWWHAVPEGAYGVWLNAVERPAVPGVSAPAVVRLQDCARARATGSEDRNLNALFPPRPQDPPPSLARAAAAPCGTCLQAWYPQLSHWPLPHALCGSIAAA